MTVCLEAFSDCWTAQMWWLDTTTPTVQVSLDYTKLMSWKLFFKAPLPHQGEGGLETSSCGLIYCTWAAAAGRYCHPFWLTPEWVELTLWAMELERGSTSTDGHSLTRLDRLCEAQSAIGRFNTSLVAFQSSATKTSTCSWGLRPRTSHIQFFWIKRQSELFTSPGVLSCLFQDKLVT